MKNFIGGLIGFGGIFLFVCAMVALMSRGASEGLEFLDGLTVDQMVATDVAAGHVAANTATPMPVPGPSSTPTPAVPEQTAPMTALSGQVVFEAPVEALVVLFDEVWVGLAHYSAPPVSFQGGGDLTPLNNGEKVVIVGIARTTAERLVVFSDGSYAPLMRGGKIVFIFETGQPVLTLEEFDARLPGQ